MALVFIVMLTCLLAKYKFEFSNFWRKPIPRGFFDWQFVTHRWHNQNALGVPIHKTMLYGDKIFLDNGAIQ